MSKQLEVFAYPGKQHAFAVNAVPMSTRVPGVTEAMSPAVALKAVDDVHEPFREKLFIYPVPVARQLMNLLPF